MKTFSVDHEDGYRDGRAVVIFKIIAERGAFRRVIAETLSNADACNICLALNTSEVFIQQEAEKMRARFENACDEARDTESAMPEWCLHETCGHNVEDGPEVGIIRYFTVYPEGSRFLSSENFSVEE